MKDKTIPEEVDLTAVEDQENPKPTVKPAALEDDSENQWANEGGRI